MTPNSRPLATLAAALATLAASLAAPAAAQQETVLAPAARFEAEPFSRVRGVLELPDRTLLVVDQTENAVWRVDLGRGARERVGGEGAGPNEYDGPTGVHPFRGDSVLVVDLGNGRLSILGPDLRMARTVPMFGPGRMLPRAVDRDGDFYFDQSTALRTARRENRQVGDQAAVVRYDLAAERGDTIAHITLPHAEQLQAWNDWDVWSTGADGRVLVVRNQEAYSVDWVMPDGSTVRGPQVREERREVSEADRARWLELHPRGFAGGLVRAGEQPGTPPAVAFPERFPFAKSQDVWVDAEGRGWVGRLESLSEQRPLYDVFDASGVRIARVRLPEKRSVVGVGRGSLYAVHVDEVDLQWLERYDISGVR